MKIVHIEDRKRVKKTKKELQQEIDDCRNENLKLCIDEYKYVPTEEPNYIISMSMKEFQLVCFYLELENRKPIINIEIDKRGIVK